MEKFDEQILLTDSFDVHQDWDTPIPAFYIVASRDSSKRSIADFDDSELAELVVVLKKIRRALKEVLMINTIYLFQNEDTEHGFHIWMFPRYEWMNQFGTKIQSVRSIMDYAREFMATDAVSAEIKESAMRMRQALSR